MFNDLNSDDKNKSTAVDDIFAETDKVPETNVGGTSPVNQAPTPTSTSAPTPAPAPAPVSANPINKIPGVNNISNKNGITNGGEIAAQKVGLSVNSNLTEGAADTEASNRWFKIILIIIVAIIVILSAYLVYSKFFKVHPKTTSSPASSSVNSKAKVATSSPSTNSNNSLKPTANSTSAPNSTGGETVIPLIPGVNTVATSSTKVVNNTPASLIDSDLDGLTDVQEKKYGTNPQVVDTDHDGLSDYGEIKIYHTDPLNPDTDGDGFSDGMEVKSGYNPLGPGKMSKTTLTIK